MASDAMEEALKVKATEALEALALACGAKGHIFMVIKGDGGKIGGCSPSLRPYGAALMDEVEKATEKPVVVTSKREPSGLLKAEKVLHTLAKTKHVELHPIVATLIQGLNEINNHKIPRVMALTDPSTMPKWFPFPPAVYAPRAQKMDLHQLFHVMDIIFGEVRGNLGAIQTLHAMLDRVYKTGNCSIGTRAGIDSFFEFLEDEAIAALGGSARAAAAAAAVKQEVADDVILTGGGVASETSGIAGGDDDGGELEGGVTGHRSRKRTRAGADRPPGRIPTPHASPVLSSANNGPVAMPPLANDDDDIDFERYIAGEGGRDLAEFDKAFGPPLPQAQPFWDQHHSHVPAGGGGAPPSDMSVAFASDVRIGAAANGAQRWEFGSSGELGQSGQSTLITGPDPRLHTDAAFQVASGHSIGNGNGRGNGNPQLTPTSNWTPPWFAEEGGTYQAQKEPPVLGNDESVVRARLQQQMLLAEQLGPGSWPAEGGQNRGVAHPLRARPMARNDGLSDSMRRDFLPGPAHMTHNDEFDYARPGMEPRLRAVALAMARAPSFSPAQTLARVPAAAAASGAASAAAPAVKPAGLLAKARGRVAPRSAAAGGPPKALKARGAAISPKPSPPSIPQQDFLPGEEFEPLPKSRSGEQPRSIRLNERRTHSGPQEAVTWTQEESTVTRQTSDPLQGVGGNSGKALKVLGLEPQGSGGSNGSSSQWSGSQAGSGTLDDESETGSNKKGLSGLFSRLGRNKNKEEGRSGKSTGGNRALGNQKHDPVKQPGAAVPPAPFQPGVYRADAWQGYVSTGGVFAGGIVPKQMSGPGAAARSGGGDGLPLLPGSIPPFPQGKDSSPRQGVSGLPLPPGSIPPFAENSLPHPRQGFSGLPVAQSSIPPEDSEAFPMHRNIQHFDSFKSEDSLLAGDREPEPEECESFPFQRPSPPSDGIQRLMQRLSVTEGPVHTAPKQAPGDGVKSPQRPAGLLGDKTENGLSPASVLKEEPFAGAYPTLIARKSTDGVVYGDDEEDDDIPGSPGFALGIGTRDDFDFDDDSHLVQGAPVTSAGSELGAGYNSVPATVISVKVVNESAGVHALPAIPVSKVVTGPSDGRASDGTGLTGGLPTVSVVVPGNNVPAEAREEHDDIMKRLQRLGVAGPP